MIYEIRHVIVPKPEIRTDRSFSQKQSNPMVSNKLITYANKAP